jgi:type I restriction enzyme S subunit
LSADCSQSREAARDRLAAASLARLNTPDPETFDADARFALDALPALTTRPDQIRKLRQTILNLAARGKMVPQDPSDEPPNLKPADCDERPEAIPSTWLYTRLVNLLTEDTRNGYSRKPDEAPNGIPILRISAGTVRRDGVVAEEEHKLISGIDGEARLQYGLKSGDLLACRFNGNKVFVGRFTIFKDYLGLQPIYPDKLIRVRVSPKLATPEFLRLAGDTDLVRAEVEAVCATTVGNWGISASNLKEIRFPLPPLAEQRRIVAKFDALMAICDRLEASLTATAATRSRLLDALLAEALSPVDARELEAAE